MKGVFKKIGSDNHGEFKDSYNTLIGQSITIASRHLPSYGSLFLARTLRKLTTKQQCKCSWYSERSPELLRERSLILGEFNC